MPQQMPFLMFLYWSWLLTVPPALDMASPPLHLPA